MYWTRALRPAQLGLSFLRARRPAAPIAIAAAPLAMLADSVATRCPGSQFRQQPVSTKSAQLFAQTVVEHAPALCDRASLRVDYDEQTFQRLIDRTAVEAVGRRALHAVVKSGTSVLGWYIADIDAHGFVEVAQLSATAATMSPVLEHLFHHAWREGGVSVTGRLDPRFMQALSDKYCVFHRRGPWVLIKSNTPELVRALESGRTCLSRLDGEWSLRFRPQHP